MLLLYYLVRRHFGVVAGLLSALALAISPISVVVTNRNATIDSTLTLCLLLGAWAVMRAAETGRFRRLLLSALFIGIGFNIKMLEAYLVVPAFGLLYLLAAPPASESACSILPSLCSCCWLSSPGCWRWTSSRRRSGPTWAIWFPRMILSSAWRLATMASSAWGWMPSENQRDCPDCHVYPLRLFLEQPLAGQTGWLLPLALLGLVALAWQGSLPRPQSPQADSVAASLGHVVADYGHRLQRRRAQAQVLSDRDGPGHCRSLRDRPGRDVAGLLWWGLARLAVAARPAADRGFADRDSHQLSHVGPVDDPSASHPVPPGSGRADQRPPRFPLDGQSESCPLALASRGRRAGRSVACPNDMGSHPHPPGDGMGYPPGWAVATEWPPHPGHERWSGADSVPGGASGSRASAGRHRYTRHRPQCRSPHSRHKQTGDATERVFELSPDGQ